jgi:hypothetical protein
MGGALNNNIQQRRKPMDSSKKMLNSIRFIETCLEAASAALKSEGLESSKLDAANTCLDEGFKEYKSLMKSSPK